jgi:hypothetical protein
VRKLEEFKDFRVREAFADPMANLGGCSSKAEPQPSKLMMWVRFPSPAPYSSAGVIRPGANWKWLMGGAEQARIAQVVEHSLGKGEVTGSSPVVGTITLLIGFWV